MASGDHEQPCSSRLKMSDEERAKLADKLDRELDDFIDALSKNRESTATQKTRKPFNFDQFCEELDQHPAFMRDIKEGENGQYSDAIQALQALKYDEPADDDAEYARIEGNKHFKLGKFRWARDAYTNGIRKLSKDPVLNSSLYGNRAACQKHLGNIKSAARDCVFAIKFNPNNWKAALRGAECIFETGKMQGTLDFIAWFENQLTDINRDDEGYRRMRENLKKLIEKATKLLPSEKRDERRREAENRRNEEEKRVIMSALRDRKLRLNPPLNLNDVEEFDLDDLFIVSPFTQEKIQERVYWDPKLMNGQGALVWPVLLVYVGAGHTDLATDCSEEFPLSQSLAEALNAPRTWDLDGNYIAGEERYFIPLDVFDKNHTREIQLDTTLGKVLSLPDHYIRRGLPVIMIYTRNEVRNKLRPINNNGIFEVL